MNFDEPDDDADVEDDVCPGCDEIHKMPKLKKSIELMNTGWPLLYRLMVKDEAGRLTEEAHEALTTALSDFSEIYAKTCIRLTVRYSRREDLAKHRAGVTATEAATCEDYEALKAALNELPKTP